MVCSLSLIKVSTPPPTSPLSYLLPSLPRSISPSISSSLPSLFLSLIHAHTSSDHSMDDESKRQLLWTMSHFLSSSEVQDFCCQVLGNVAITGEYFTSQFAPSPFLLYPFCPPPPPPPPSLLQPLRMMLCILQSSFSRSVQP